MKDRVRLEFVVPWPYSSGSAGKSGFKRDYNDPLTGTGARFVERKIQVDDQTSVDVMCDIKAPLVFADPDGCGSSTTT